MAKAWKVEGLRPDQPLTESARLIIAAKFREAFSFREEVRLGQDIEAIHNMRVSLRRLWAAMTGFSNCFDYSPEFKLLIGRTRKLARRLGAVRDLDVLLEILRGRAAEPGISEAKIAALNHLIESCLIRRDKQHVKLMRHFQKLDERQFEAEFLRFFEGAESEGNADLSIANSSVGN